MILRKAKRSELPMIWEILQFAIEQRKQDGSDQWQDGYPNETTIQQDLDNGYAYVISDEKDVVFAYAAILFDKEPAYENIEGYWLSDGDYAVVHRVATSKDAKGKGVAMKLFLLIADLCREKNVYSIRVDTNFDNAAMLKVLERSGYVYCGQVYFRGQARKAYEKIVAAS